MQAVPGARADGAPGLDGSSCSVTNNGNGTATVRCTNGTSVTFAIVPPGRTSDAAVSRVSG